MARKVTTLLICDSPHDTETSAAGTISFGLGSDQYETELCPDCRKKLERHLSKFAACARPAVPARARPSRSPAARARNRECRAWARKNGWPDLPARGPMPKAAVAAFSAR